MIPYIDCAKANEAGVSRTRGDDPYMESKGKTYNKCFPHTRG